MISVSIKDELKRHSPGMVLATIQCSVENTPYNKELWQRIDKASREIVEKYDLDTIRTQKNIAATRKVYRNCGKDPNRYRPSADSLYRRVVKGNNLYQINTLVDIVNLFSILTGYSIGGFDGDKIVGQVHAGVGRKDEAYEGIGRGALNVDCMPILRDEIGGIGTPTSDEVRTAISHNTKNFFMNINAYTGREEVEAVLPGVQKKLRKFLNAQNMTVKIIE